MLARLRYIISVAAYRWQFVMSASLGFVVFYYGVLLTALVIKFRQLPNYFHWYDWPGNVQRIIESTPSAKDTMMIIRDEWLFEIGFMNYDFGMGISEWSLFLSPAKALAVAGLGMMLALLYLLARSRAAVCSGALWRSSLLTGGLGGTLVSFSLMSLSWVVCCATPTWVVGLAILGLGVSTSLWLEPMGIWLNAGGFTLLLGALLVLAKSPLRDSAPSRKHGHPDRRNELHIDYRLFHEVR